MGMQRAATLEVIPDVTVDGFVADEEFTLPAQEAGDLFWAPELTQQGFDSTEVLGAEVPIASRSRATTAGHEDGFGGPIVPGTSTVAPELATDGAAMAFKVKSDLRLIQALLAQRGNHIPLLRGELAIAMAIPLVLPDSRSRHYPSSPRFQGGFVLHLVYEFAVPNKRIEFAPCGRPTRKGDAPLLAAHSRRWASRDWF